jgi:hypothetical protein
MAEVVVHMSIKYKALNSKLSNIKTKNKQKDANFCFLMSNILKAIILYFCLFYFVLIYFFVYFWQEGNSALCFHSKQKFIWWYIFE